MGIYTPLGVNLGCLLGTSMKLGMKEPCTVGVWPGKDGAIQTAKQVIIMTLSSGLLNCWGVGGMEHSGAAFRAWKVANDGARLSEECRIRG